MLHMASNGDQRISAALYHPAGNMASYSSSIATWAHAVQPSSVALVASTLEAISTLFRQQLLCVLSRSRQCILPGNARYGLEEAEKCA
jgi:hypothetical protein